MASNQTYNFSSIVLCVCAENLFTRRLITKMSRALGFKVVHHTGDQAEAGAILSDKHIDIFVLDFSDESAFELMRQVRDQTTSANPFVPTIGLATQALKSTIVRARDSGCTEFVTLPLSAQTYVEKLIHVIERPREYVRSMDFFGPNRRRRRDDEYWSCPRLTGQPARVG